MDKPKTYEDGLRDGRIEALEHVAHKVVQRLDVHSDRIRALERICWGLAGILAFVNLWPAFYKFLGG